jgi:hypothetical protein
VTNGEVLVRSGSNWVNNTLAEAGIATPGDITTAVNNLQIGGRNLLVGASNGNGWIAGTKNGTEFSLTRASTTETGYIYSRYFELKGNTTYTLSFESKEDETIKSRDLFILSDSLWRSGVVIGKSFDKSSDWHKVVWTFTTPLNFNGVTDLRLRIDHNGSTDGSAATIWVRNVQLELGNKATDFTIPPEDVQAAIDLKANIASPSFTGIPLAPTAAIDNNSNQIATTAFVKAQNYLTSITKAQVEAVLTGNISSHTHSYLPLTGGTLSGTLYMGSKDLYFNASDSGDIVFADATNTQKARI